MRHIFFVLSLSLLTQFAFAQAPEDVAARWAQTITIEDLQTHLNILASDEMEGRETGQPGQERAARYLEGVVKGFGLPPVGTPASYSQPISFISERWKDISMMVNEKDQRHLWDYYAYPSKNSSREEVVYDELVFLGYGIDTPSYSDYKGQDVAGKAILIFMGEPTKGDGTSVVTGSSTLSEWSSDIDKKLMAAHTAGVSTVFIIDPDFQKNLSSARKIALDSRMHMGFGEAPEDRFSNSVFISAETARRMLDKKYKQVVKARNKIVKKGKPRSVTIPCDLTLSQVKKVRQLQGENIVGFIEGSDPVMKEEIVIVTAHYDHIGRRGRDIFNGADDNGSGTSAVLEVCQAFAQAKAAGQGPRRSVLFMWVSGEEKGLLGSQYYVENPLFPLENAVANINVDMIGRIDKEHVGNPFYIYVIGSDRLSTELHQINEEMNDTYTKLELDYTYNDENDPNRYYYRSDHYNFAERGIPAVFFFNGTHPDYHQASDTVDKINFEKMVAIGQLVFHDAWELANRDKRIEVDVPQD